MMSGRAGVAELAGLRVPIVEDEILIAMEVEDLLSGRGAAVIGPANNALRALALIEAGAPDVAVLDIALTGGTAAPIADALRARAIPFVVVTGHAEPPTPALRRAPRVGKPFTGDELVAAVIGAVSGMSRPVAR